MSLIVWSWMFLAVYMGGMLAFGLIGRSRVHGADDFATARAAYGPFVLGALWSGVTRSGAYTGLIVGLSSFLILHTGVIDPAWFEGSFLHPVFSWLHGESPNPTSCAALAGLFAMGCTAAVSLATRPLPEAHVATLFRRAPATD